MRSNAYLHRGGTAHGAGTQAGRISLTVRLMVGLLYVLLVDRALMFFLL